MEKQEVSIKYKKWLISRIFSLIANRPVYHDMMYDVNLIYSGDEDRPGIKERFTVHGISFFENPETFLSKIGIDMMEDLSELEREKITGFCKEIKLANSNGAIRSICGMARNISNSFYFY
ncbi:MAG TPA: hypothetical protein PK886_02895 [Candidatus Paceibacterota bacterium]|nr:hypothetical protein [Candidatus Paceibacterota bacterium]